MSRIKSLRNATVFLMLAAFLQLHAVEVNPGYPDSIPAEKKDRESPLRRGEVIFFISYPFTFLISLLAYGLAGYAASAIDGKNNFALQGGGFFGLVAATAGIFSFGIAMTDYYEIKAQPQNTNVAPAPVGYLSLSFRF